MVAGLDGVLPELTQSSRGAKPRHDHVRSSACRGGSNGSLPAIVTRLFFTPVTLLALVLVGGCDSQSPVRRAETSPAVAATDLDRARQDSIVRSRPGYAIDSIRPVEEDILRFQAALGPRPEAFTNGAPNRTALVAEFARAIERNDTTALARLVVDRAEFGYLIYPASPNARPPYRQAPDIVWLQRSASTARASSRLLARFGGRPLKLAGHACPAPPDHQGENTVWTGCVVRRADAGHGDTTTVRLFGAIVERGGRYKFLSLANAL